MNAQMNYDFFKFCWNEFILVYILYIEVIHMLSMDKNQISITQYNQLIKVDNNCIVIQMKDFNLTINGSCLHIDALEKEELLLEGKIQQITFFYDK